MSESKSDDMGQPDGSQQTTKVPHGGKGSIWDRVVSGVYSVLLRVFEHKVLVILGLIVLLATFGIMELVVVHKSDEIWKNITDHFDSEKNKEKIVLAVFPDDTTSAPIKSGLGLEQGNTKKLLVDNTYLDFVSEEGAQSLTAEDLEKKLNDPNVVLVIGHYSSTTAEYMLTHVYEQKKESPVPLILPAVTNPGLTRAPLNSVKHILRLPASDNKQVEELGRLLDEMPTLLEHNRKSRKALRVTLVVDNTNPLYSDYISQELVKQNPKRFVDSVGVSLGGDGFRPERFEGSNPDVIVFVGMETQGEIFLRSISESRQWSSPGSHKPILVFTDGVAGTSFREVAKDVAASGFRIVLTAPIPTAEPRGGSLGERFADYKEMGDVSQQLASILLDRAMRDSHEVTRDTVLKALQGLMMIGQSDVDKEKLKKLHLEFDENGDNAKGRIHVYEFTSGGAIHSCLCLASDEETPYCDARTITGQH